MMALLILRSIGTAAPAFTSSRAADRAAAERASAVAGADAANAAPDDAELDGPRIPVVGPPIGAVLAASYITAGLDHDPTSSWTRRARLGGLVPWVTVRTARDTSWQDEHSEVGHGTTLEVRATWRLDRLVFDSHELQASNIDAARRRERRRLATRVIRSYFAWRRAAGTSPGANDDRVAARAAEATAELDALTDGWFSDELLRLQRGTSGPPTRRTPGP
jgi:hypothetical protein